jgi:hypothetical protein
MRHGRVEFPLYPFFFFPRTTAHNYNSQNISSIHTGASCVLRPTLHFSIPLAAAAAAACSLWCHRRIFFSFSAIVTRPIVLDSHVDVNTTEQSRAELEGKGEMYNKKCVVWAGMTIVWMLKKK